MNHFTKELKHASDTKLILQMLQDEDEALFGNECQLLVTKVTSLQ